MCWGKVWGLLMYPTTVAWTARNVDYRQIAIMIGHIEGNDNPHSIPPQIGHLFRSCIMKVNLQFVCSAIIIGTFYVQVNMMQSYMKNGIHKD